jgi:flavin reductase ActVB
MSTVTNQDRQLFRDAMASYPSGVTIVTTTDANGRWWGFTATSFCSASVAPPLVLVCLARTAECYAAFREARGWVIHIIHPNHADLAVRFATRGADKFAGGRFREGEDGLPVLDEAAVTLHCSPYTQYPAGDHSILVGRVKRTSVDEAQVPALYFRRSYHALPVPG